MNLFPPWFPYREPKKPEGHPLIGNLDETEEEDIRAMLIRVPPTDSELVVLGLEEMRCCDRASVYRLLEEFKS